jgi:hypothetical protein
MTVGPDAPTLRERLQMAQAAARCGANRKHDGGPCQGPAMANGRCRLHGGKSTGPRTAEGLARTRRANWKHGHYSAEARAERAKARASLRELRHWLAVALCR